MKNRPRGGLGRGLGALIPTAPPAAGGTTTTEEPPPPPPAAVPDPTPAPTSAPPAAEATAPPQFTAPASPAPIAEDDGGLAPVPGARFAELPVTAIEPNAKQPRHVFDEEALEELKTSIQEVGFLQPIVVRDVGGGRYELVMGERRWRAAQAVGKETIPAIIRDTRDDAMLRDALLENIHRANLNPLEEAAAYQQLLEEFGATHEELASKIGRSRSQVTNTIRLMKLPVKVQTRVAAGVISAGHARALLGLQDADAQDALATRIVAEGMSVRATEEAVAMAASERPTAKRRARNISAPGVEELGTRLSDRFETKVKIQIGRAKGRIVVEFGSVDDLQRIIGVMAPEITGRRD